MLHITAVIFLLLSSCISNNNLNLQNKGLDNEIREALQIKEECIEDSYPCTDHCKRCKKVRTIMKWIDEPNMLEFKDEDGRNKLMILSTELRADKFEFKHFCIKKSINEISKQLKNSNNSEEKNIEILENFDTSDSSERKTLTHISLLSSIDLIISYIDLCLATKYDLKICEPSSESGLSDLCMILGRIKNSRIYQILDKFQIISPSIFKNSVDNLGSTPAVIASAMNNSYFFKYFLKKENEDKLTLFTPSLRLKNSAKMDCLISLIRLGRNTILSDLLNHKWKNQQILNLRHSDREYGRTLLLVAGAVNNREAMDILFKNGAVLRGQNRKRIWKKTKKVGKFVFDIIAKTADAGIQYSSEYFLGVKVSTDICSSTVQSFRKNLMPISKPVIISEEMAKEAINSVNEYVNIKFKIYGSMDDPIELYDLVLDKIRILRRDDNDDTTKDILNKIEEEVKENEDAIDKEKEKRKKSKKKSKKVFVKEHETDEEIEILEDLTSALYRLEEINK